jgi:thiol-disulfide isomerase/thioredoxin
MKILVFKSKNCLACKAVTPILEDIKRKNNLNVIEYDIQSESGSIEALSYGAVLVPTIIKIDDNENIESYVGFTTRESLEEFLK